jgi:hypothetical protein
MSFAISTAILSAVKHVIWVLAALTLAAAAPSLALGRSSAPAVLVTDRQPLTVKGFRFRSGERVTVVLVLGGRHARTVRVGRSGSFVARFAEHADLCTAYTVRAMSGRSVRAAIQQRPARSCAPLDPIR